MSKTDTSKMKIRSLAPWFGGKRNMAPIIVEELGQHTCYWEPFCGSMATLFAKPVCTMETVNDLHGELVNLARVVRCRISGPKLYRLLRRTLFAADFHAESHKVLKELETGEIASIPDIERAYHYFVASWMGRNGTSGQSQGACSSFCVRYTRSGGHAGTRWRNVIDSVPQWRRRLENVTILNLDGFEILERIDDTRSTAIYVDPPYIQKTGSYLHDLDPDDHVRLAEILNRFEHARVVLSYYDHELLDELYSGWTKRLITVNKLLAVASQRGSKATEALLINGPSYSKSEPGLFT